MTADTCGRQTSIRSGIVLGMGKGFYCSDNVKGRDLGDVIQQGFNRAVCAKDPSYRAFSLI